MTGLRGDAAIIGYTELRPERKSTLTPRPTIEQWALLSKAALDDSGIEATAVDGLVASHISESARFVPATLAEYLGFEINLAEFVDLGGATSAGMIWRAAAAVEMGLAEVVLCTVPAGPVSQAPERPTPNIRRYGASSELFGSPQAEFEIPYGNVAQNAPYAMIANRYAAEFGYDAEALAKIAVEQRFNACANPNAVFYGKPISIDDVLASPMVCDPIHMLETVMRVSGGAAVVVASRDVARRARHRPVWIVGCGERLEFKTPTYARELLHTPMTQAADPAFAMAGISRQDIDMVSVYDCYTITVLLTLEDAGFCDKGTGAKFVREHDLTYRGDFPCNTHGGQLSFGQSGLAGGMSHICDATRQIMGRAGAAQISGCDSAFVTGNGGIMSEQVALILRGE